MSNGNGNSIEGLPTWLRGAIVVVLQVGFPGAVAALLLAALFGWIRSPLMTKLESMEYQMWQMSTTMRAICYGMQVNEAVVRYRCEPWKPEKPD